MEDEEYYDSLEAEEPEPLPDDPGDTPPGEPGPSG